MAIHTLVQAFVGNAGSTRDRYAVFISLAGIMDYGSTKGPVVVPQQPAILVTADTMDEIREKVLEMLDEVLQLQEPGGIIDPTKGTSTLHKV